MKYKIGEELVLLDDVYNWEHKLASKGDVVVVVGYPPANCSSGLLPNAKKKLSVRTDSGMVLAVQEDLLLVKDENDLAFKVNQLVADSNKQYTELNKLKRTCENQETYLEELDERIDKLEQTTTNVNVKEGIDRLRRDVDKLKWALDKETNARYAVWQRVVASQVDLEQRIKTLEREKEDNSKYNRGVEEWDIEAEMKEREKKVHERVDGLHQRLIDLEVKLDHAESARGAHWYRFLRLEEQVRELRIAADDEYE